MRVTPSVDSSPLAICTMSGLVAGVFKATVGFLVSKGRDVLAEKLHEGDILDHKMRDIIVREINDVKSKLHGLARKDLLAAVEFLEEGLILVFDALRTKTPSSPTVETKTFALALMIKKMDFIDMDESENALLANAKKRFDDARRKATEAFSDEALKTPERIEAMGYRILATLLESIDNPSAAISTCQSCIEKLHSLPAVQNCFSVALSKSFLGRFSKDERREIVLSICRLNRVVYDLTFMVHDFGSKEISGIPHSWPYIETGCKDAKVNPLTDPRVAKILQKLGMKHYCLQWSFGQEGEQEHKLEEPWGMATNSRGHFIIADNKDHNVKVYSRSGSFLYSFSPVTDALSTAVCIHDVATDKNNDIYVLLTLNKPGAGTDEAGSYVYMKTPNRTIPLKTDFRSWSWTWSSLAVTDNNKIVVRGALVDGHHVVDVYRIDDGQFVRRFGKGALEISSCVAAANDGGVIVASGGRDSYWVNAFSKKGKRLHHFKVERSFDYLQTTFHQASEHVVVAGINVERGKENHLEVLIYTKEGEYVRSIQYEEEDILYVRGITVTTDGRIAVIYKDKVGFKVLVT